MKIVVLDGYALNPGDLTWDELEKLGKCAIYDRTAPEQRLERAHDAEVVLLNKVVLDRELLRDLPKLRFVCVLSTGVNVVDLQAARERGIPVSNVPVYGTRSVGQMTMAFCWNSSITSATCPDPSGKGDGCRARTGAIGTSHLSSYTVAKSG